MTKRKTFIETKNRKYCITFASLVVQGVGQGSGVHHRLDEGSWVDQRHRVDDWSGVDNGHGVNHWSSVDGNGGMGVGGGLHDGSNHWLHHRLAVHLGDALVGNRRGSRVHHRSNLGQNGLVHHMVSLDETSTGGGDQESDDADLYGISLDYFSSGGGLWGVTHNFEHFDIGIFKASAADCLRRFVR